MIFNSITFLLFFVIVYSMYWAIPTQAGKKWLLLLASYVFYGAWSPPYVLLLLLSTSLDWWLARLIGKSSKTRRRRMLLWTSIAANIGLLGYFKYGAFLLANFITLLASAGFSYHPAEANIILPIGISFYTFASLSYTIDVYRRETPSDWKFSDYALFVSFFPHLVAGPILRARDLLPQIASLRRPNGNEIGWGFAMICFGLFCKVVMADAVFAPIVDQIYANPGKFGMIDILVGVLSFSGQIYYDFNGYSLCAIGLAMCFGIAFPDNFHHPYAAIGFSDFWRRWHISLSSWLRDYLYIPLGGNRDGEWRTYQNLMLTMLIGGLWHGASWMFVLWGGLHGFYLAAERMAVQRLESRVALTSDNKVLLQLLTFMLVSLTWVPFRAPTPENALAIATGLLRIDMTSILEMPGLMAIMAIIVTLRWHMQLHNRRFESVISDWGRTKQVAAMASCLIAMFMSSGGDQRAFIYFQF